MNPPMQPPLRRVGNDLGELADLKDAADRYVAHCSDPEDARAILEHVNGRDALVGRVEELTSEVAALRRFLRNYEQTTQWHAARRRLMRTPGAVPGDEDR